MGQIYTHGAARYISAAASVCTQRADIIQHPCFRSLAKDDTVGDIPMSYTPLVCRTLSCRFEAGTHIGFMLKQPRQTQVGLDWRSDVPASRAEGKTCGARSGPVFSLYTSKSSPYTLGGGFVQSAVIIAHALRTVRRYTHISLSQSSRSPFWDP